METDPEMLEAFAQEILEIKKALAPLVAAMNAQPQEASNLEKFGQVIDGIYGTAATLGFQEMAAYCRELKFVSYKCSQSSNSYAIGKVKELCLTAYGMLDKLSSVVKNPTEVKKIQYTMQKEREHAEALSKNLLGTINRTTTKK